MKPKKSTHFKKKNIKNTNTYKQDFSKDSSSDFKKSFFKKDSSDLRGNFPKKDFSKDSSSDFKKKFFKKDSSKKDFSKDSSSDFKKKFFKKDSSDLRGNFPKKDFFKKDFSKDSSSDFKKSFSKKIYSSDSRENLTEDDENKNFQIEGRRAVIEALNSDTTIDKLYIKFSSDSKFEGSLNLIYKKAQSKGVFVVKSSKQKLDLICNTPNHQGVIAVCPAYEYTDIHEIINISKSKNEDAFILVLDSITDPQNLGAIIRTAEVCGVHGIIIPKRRSALLTTTVSKISAGALVHVPIAKVTNISNAIDLLKKSGIWVTCADTYGENCYKATLTGPIAIVIGNEGFGASKVVREKCDFSIKLPMFGKINSLNASVAAGALMYEVLRQKHFC